MGILKPEYLKTIHYYYFFISVFSLFNAFILGIISLWDNIFFITLSLVNFCVSMYVTWISLKEMRKFLIIQYLKYIAYHFLIVLLASFCVLFLWIFLSEEEISLFSWALVINLIIFVIAFAFLILHKTEYSEKISYYYKKIQFNLAKRSVVRLAKRMGFNAVIIEMIKSLRYEEDKDFFDILLQIKTKKESEAANELRELKTLVLERKIKEVEETVKKLKKKPMTSDNIESIKEYEKMLRKLKNIKNGRV